MNLKHILGALAALLIITACNNSAINYQTKEIPQFYVIGISVRTTNLGGQSQKDIGDLFNKFMMQNVAARIPNKECNDTYCVYTDYESDAMHPYTALLGCKVKSLDNIPAGMVGKAIPATKYQVYTSTGKLPDCVVNTWLNIWKSAIQRKYTADFDVYGDKAKNPVNAEVETFVSVK